jgi:hypothetical protein
MQMCISELDTAAAGFGPFLLQNRCELGMSCRTCAAGWSRGSCGGRKHATGPELY